MRTNLMAVANMQGEPGMDKAGEVVSGEAYKRRQFLSDQAHFQYFDNLTLAIAQCWRVMVSWIPVYMSEPGRIQRIIGEDSTPQMVTLNEKTNEGGIAKIKNDLSVGRYDVVMDTGPGYESKREEGAENLLKLLDIPALAEMVVKLGADLVFRSIDHPYMQELADRVQAANPEGLEKIMEGLSGRAKSIVQALANEVHALQQKNQELEQEQKFGMAKAHLVAVTKAHDTETVAETKRFDTVVRSHTDLARTEIQAGASLLNTHAEAEHHSRKPRE
jgi:hypothetical protein